MDELQSAQSSLTRALGRSRAGEDRELAQRVRELGEQLAKGFDAPERVFALEGAAPGWRALVQRLHAGSPSKRPAPPPGVVKTAVGVL